MTHRFQFPCFACSNTIFLDGVSAERAKRIVELVITEVQRIEQKFSRYRADSVVTKINESAGGSPVEVDEETSRLLDFAALAFESSGGRFDPTSGVLRQAWNFRDMRVPMQTQIDEILPLIGWQRVEWSAPYVRLPILGMEIDFGGFGKEYAVDRAAAILEQEDVAHGLVNFGGDVRAIGPKISGDAWLVGIRHPRAPEATLQTLPLKVGAVATSGDYERSFTAEGKRYHHILDARTGWPVAGAQSVTALHDTCVTAGILSTSAMLLPEVEAEAFLRSAGVSFLLVSSAGVVTSS